jgi:hypothetical protein
MREILILTGSLVLLLTGCASGPTIITNSSPDADFSRLGTYNFMQQLSTDRPDGVRTRLSTMLINSMTREMESRGFRQSDTPDLLVNFFVDTEDRLDVRTVPVATSVHTFRHGRYMAWGGYRTVVREYTRGTLYLDMVDADKRVLAWEGVAEGRLRQDVRQVTQEQIDDIVGQMMAEFVYSVK